MGSQERICRLCLKICDSFKAIQGDTKDVLHKFLPKINLAVTQEPVMCINCAEMVIKCSDFKEACSSTYSYIVSCVNNKNALKLDLKDVYLSKNENSSGVPEDQDICGFCMGTVKNYSVIFINIEEGDVMLKMIEQCLPELDLRIIQKSIICVPCCGSLEACFRFMTNCWTVEEKIKKYCETLDMNSKGQIELSSLLEFTTKDAIKSEVDDNLVNLMKVEQFSEEGENADEREIGNGNGIFKLERIFCEDSENTTEATEHKNESFMGRELKFNNEEQFSERKLFVCKEGNNLDVIKREETSCEENELKEEDPVEMEGQKFLLNQEIEIKPDEPDFVRLDGGIEQSCLMPSLATDPSKPDIKQISTNQSTPTTKIYQCIACSFQTKYKQNLKIHLLKHKDPAEVPMYRCNFCSFETKHKNGLSQHFMVHKKPSEVTMYKCNTCSFETKYKRHLRNHFLIHSELKTFKCDTCLFETKRKYDLKMHLLKHKDPSEITMHKCDLCVYQTRRKYTLKCHKLTHKKKLK